jgi:hypothetical protein
VPDLSESAHKDRPSTVREQLERHRANPVCASCHRNIDPAGFALENYDAVGQWRTATPEGLAIGRTALRRGENRWTRRAGRRCWTSPILFVGTITRVADLRARRGLGRWTCRLSATWSPRRRAELRHAVDRERGRSAGVPFQMRTMRGTAPPETTGRRRVNDCHEEAHRGGRSSTGRGDDARDGSSTRWCRHSRRSDGAADALWGDPSRTASTRSGGIRSGRRRFEFKPVMQPLEKPIAATS